ncbi:MAG: hypothetical protein LUP97_05090 [Methanoregula sp.]|nr:hypothetical protein [Methanoregula sp.]
MRVLDFSHPACKDFEYKNFWYTICPDAGPQNRGWYVRQHPSLWDACRPWGSMKRISGYSADPQELLRTVTIDGASIEDILKELPEKDRSPIPLFDFDYDKFLIDIFHHSERVFYFRGHYYFIDYWGPDSDAFWTPGWIFSNDQEGATLAVNDSDFEEFIRKVDVWMKRYEGVSLREMFDTFYKNDMTGDLRLDSIYFF